MFRIRVAAAEDLEPMRAIYAPLVRETAVSFETSVPSAGEWARRVRAASSRMPWLVADREGQVAGYAYAVPHRSRPAYRFSAEVSVYVHGDARRTGVGRALYGALLRLLELQGLRNACAGITLPNPASVALHESLGFEPVGVYRAVGHKLGRWHDVGWWQRRLGRDSAEPPAEPRDWSDLVRSEEVRGALGPAAPGGA